MPANGATAGNIAIKSACFSLKLKFLISIAASIVAVSIIVAVTVTVLNGNSSDSNISTMDQTTTPSETFTGEISTTGTTQSSSDKTTYITTVSTESPIICPKNFTRTVIFMQADVTTYKLFFRGGVTPYNVNDGMSCASNVDSHDPCAVRIIHNGLRTVGNYSAYNAWAKGDNYLDWYGPENGQKEYGGVIADGTPAGKTTNDSKFLDTWHPLNTFGANYWLADLCMDCSQTISNWFEIKSIISDEWEHDVSQPLVCDGTAPLSDRSKSFSSGNHIGRCGKINVFKRNDDSCVINNFYSYLHTTSNFGSTVAPSTSAIVTSTATTVTASNSVTSSGLTITTPPATCSDGFNKTVILIQSQTVFGENLFLRGGNDHSRVLGECLTNVSDYNPCAVRMYHRDPPVDSAYSAWSVGDTFLDWYGSENGQGQFNGKHAEGSPMMWTTNDRSNPSWNPLNTFGDGYWLADLCMNCSQTVSGWFEFKSVITGNEWENDISQTTRCTGTAADSERKAPFTTRNHVGYCGKLNAVVRNRADCIINSL